MEASSAKILVVAHKTASTPNLIQAVRERAAKGPATFTLLVPNPAHGLHRVVDPEDLDTDEARQTIELATPLLEEAAGHDIEHIIGVSDPLDAIQDAMNLHGGFDELIISTLPAKVSRWLHIDLPHKATGLGVPVTTVTPKGIERLEAHTG